jgi:hypothetical protein
MGEGGGSNGDIHKYDDWDGTTLKKKKNLHAAANIWGFLAQSLQNPQPLDSLD